MIRIYTKRISGNVKQQGIYLKNMLNVSNMTYMLALICQINHLTIFLKMDLLIWSNMRSLAK